MALDTPPLLSNVVDSFEFTSSADDSSVASVLDSKSIDLKSERGDVLALLFESIKHFAELRI